MIARNLCVLSRRTIARRKCSSSLSHDSTHCARAPCSGCLATSDVAFTRFIAGANGEKYNVGVTADTVHTRAFAKHVFRAIDRSRIVIFTLHAIGGKVRIFRGSTTSGYDAEERLGRSRDIWTGLLSVSRRSRLTPRLFSLTEFVLIIAEAIFESTYASRGSLLEFDVEALEETWSRADNSASYHHRSEVSKGQSQSVSRANTCFYRGRSISAIFSR